MIICKLRRLRAWRESAEGSEIDNGLMLGSVYTCTRVTQYSQEQELYSSTSTSLS